MGALIFKPFSIGLGIAAGIVGRKIFAKLWGLVDQEELPGPEHREVRWAKLLPALLVEGAIYWLVRGLADRGLRRAFLTLTGSWPGEQRPEEE